MPATEGPGGSSAATFGGGCGGAASGLLPSYVRLQNPRKCGAARTKATYTNLSICPFIYLGMGLCIYIVREKEREQQNKNSE